MVKILLQAGADPKIRSAEVTPLYEAVEAGNVEMARLLLSYKADARATSHGRTALVIAQEKGNTELVNLLRRVVATQAP